MEGQESEGGICGGRLLPGGQRPGNPSTLQKISERDGHLASTNALSGITPYNFRLQGASSQPQGSGGGRPLIIPGQFAVANPLGNVPPGAFNVSDLGSALPESRSSQNSSGLPHDLQRVPSGPSVLPPRFGAQQLPPFAGQTIVTNNPGYPPYSPQYAYPQQPPTVPPYAQSHTGPQAHSGGVSPAQATYVGQQYLPTQAQPYMYYSGHYGQLAGQQPQGFQAHQGPYSPIYNRAPSLQYTPGFFPQQEPDPSTMGGKLQSNSKISPGLSMNIGFNSPETYLRPGSGQVISRGSSNSSTGAIPSSPRGPPRKPRQSGHALWVGNLPSGALVNDLKDHFSRDAKDTIESVFLISKSNCAFVNYRTEAACAAAMERFHDSRFQNVRLVCRLRRSSAPPSSGIPTGPAALLPTSAQSQTALEAIAQNREISSRAEELSQADPLQESTAISKVVDKYFVLKSLTVEDMELSVRNGIWATQAHNEEALNKAFETAENVYLIFSANKSGEYFGYARMASAISEEAAASLDWAPRAEVPMDDPDVPRFIPTPATEFAPKGRIIDDSARGTIFWEADPEDEDRAAIIDGEVADDEETISAEGGADSDELATSSGPQPFGKPFKIEWLATNRLPFYRTRGLRNPWNANREVKIARDGTELETSVGRRLIQMFQRSPPSAGPTMRMPSISGRTH